MTGYLAPFTEMPIVVVPRRFSPARDHQPYRRPQRADEVADWLAADGWVLARATREARQWSPGARWMYWEASTPFLEHFRFSVAYAPRLSDIVERNQNRVDTAHLIMAFESEFTNALRSSTSDELDHVWEWLRFPYSTDATGLPGVLVNEAEQTLAHASHHTPGRIPPLSPAQWREGIRFDFSRDAPFDRNASSRNDSLMDRARGLVRLEVRRRLEAVGDAGVLSRPARRL